jgi:hypothetical protein
MTLPDVTTAQALGLPRRLLLSGAAASAALASVQLTGCASAQKIEDYAAEKPVFDLRQYFSGRLMAYGTVQDRGGKVTRRMEVVMNCSWQGDVGTLDEDFTYADGKKEKRVWTLRKLPDSKYVGTAADVVGEAQGQARGNAFYWTYTLRLPVEGGSVYDVRLDDWMYMLNDKIVLNKAELSYFGIRLADITITFVKA